MLFNSSDFLFVFLPIALVGFYVLSRANRGWATAWLALVSLYFYADWRPAYLWIILISIAGNFTFGRLVGPTSSHRLSKKALLVSAISLNLGALIYYKYSSFALTNLSNLLSTDWEVPSIVLPLAISFFTFQQIAFLVDSYRGLCHEYSFASYCLFVSFFPQLIAGPIVHHSEMLPQFEEEKTSRVDFERIAVGLTILGIGLFKKVVIADGVAPYSTGVFNVLDSGGVIATGQAWGGAIAYTLQIYFDFSGYSDMAVGSARLFGITLPLNFFSPYKATSVIDFWRRWHMTLSRFLRDYLYFGLGGNRKGTIRRYANLMATMVLGGIWHGAGWNFLIWGALHGTYLVLNHSWRATCRHFEFSILTESKTYAVISWMLTFLSVVCAWVFFRAETFDGAVRMLQIMFSFSPTVSTAAPSFGLIEILTLASLVASAVFFPNIYETMRDTKPVIDMPKQESPTGAISVRWSPNIYWAATAGALTCVALLHLGRISEFLYFQF